MKHNVLNSLCKLFIIFFYTLHYDKLFRLCVASMLCIIFSFKYKFSYIIIKFINCAKICNQYNHNAFIFLLEPLLPIHICIYNSVLVSI